MIQVHRVDATVSSYIGSKANKRVALHVHIMHVWQSTHTHTHTLIPVTYSNKSCSIFWNSSETSPEDVGKDATWEELLTTLKLL